MTPSRQIMLQHQALIDAHNRRTKASLYLPVHPAYVNAFGNHTSKARRRTSLEQQIPALRRLGFLISNFG